MRVLEVQWSRALGLVCEVALVMNEYLVHSGSEDLHAH